MQGKCPKWREKIGGSTFLTVEVLYNSLPAAFTCSKSLMGTQKQCEICSKFTIKTPEPRH